MLEARHRCARRIAALEPNRPEGHFWIAANMGALAESFGLRQGLRYRGDIKDELLTVLKLDPAFPAGIGRSRARPLVLTRCRAVRRQQQEVGGAPAQVAHLQPEQHRVAVLPRRDADRRWIAKEDARARAAESRSTRRSIPSWAPEDREFKQKPGALATRRHASRSER